MLAPAGTPREVITALNVALQDALDDPDVLKAWAASGMAPYPAEQRKPEGAAAYLHREIEHWSEVVRDNHIEAPSN
jgi:tripartite-type tricarboxylate transporter receptor subunit TctC